MKAKQFNSLSIDKQVELVNKRTLELKEAKQTTAEFSNDEYEFSYSHASTVLAKSGYKYDRESGQFIKSNDITISFSEYEGLKKENERLRMNKIESDKYLEAYKKIKNEDKIRLQVNIETNVLSSWKEYTSNELLSSNVLISVAMMKYIDTPLDLHETLDIIKDFSTYESFSINIPKSLLISWKEYCNSQSVFTSNQLLSVALKQY